MFHFPFPPVYRLPLIPARSFPVSDSTAIGWRPRPTEQGTRPGAARPRVVPRPLTGQRLGQREEGRIVGHVAGGEEESGRLVVEAGQLRLQPLVEQRVAGDVTGAAGAGAVLPQRGTVAQQHRITVGTVAQQHRVTVGAVAWQHSITVGTVARQYSTRA